MKINAVKKNRKRKCVYVQVVGEEANRIHAITHASQKEYADRIGADYKILRPKTVGVNVFSKSCSFHHTRFYDQSLILDVDVVPTKLATNIFDLVPIGKWGVVDDAHMRSKDRWHEHQNILNKLLERKGIEPTYLSKVANTGVIVTPHNPEVIWFNDDREPCTTNAEEKVWFTYNLQRTDQEIIWLDDLWNVCSTDPLFNAKYPYANFIHRNEEAYKLRNLKSDVIQHIADVNIPSYRPGGNAIVTINFSRDPFYGSVRDSIVEYANRTGAQLIEITGTYSQGMHYCWPKYYAAIVAKDFDKTLYLDTDVYVDEMAPSIFDRIPNNHWCFVDESGLIGNSTLTMEYDQCLANHNLIRKGRWQIYNAGIMVIPPHGINLYNHKRPWVLDKFWDEQTLLNNTIVGKEFHVIDTSWDTMPFTRSIEPIKFFHAAGGGKFHNLSQFLDHEFCKILLFWPGESMEAERLSKSIDKQICNGIMIGHYNYDKPSAQEEIRKYVTIVDDPTIFSPNLVLYIDTPVSKKMPNRPSVYIITPNDFSTPEKIKNAKMWGNITRLIATDRSTLDKALEHGIKISNIVYKYHIPIPGKDGKSYNYIDDNDFLVGMIYSPCDKFRDFIDRLMTQSSYKVVVIDDYTKSSKCTHRMNNLRSSGNFLSRVDVLVDITDRHPYNQILLEAVLTKTPVAARGMDIDIYDSADDDIIDIVFRLQNRSVEHLNRRSKELIEYLDYDKCWSLWKSLIESTENEQKQPQFTI